MNKSLYIIGAGSVGGHVASNPDLYKLTYDAIYFLDDDTQKIGKDFVNCKVIDCVDYLLQTTEEVDVVIGIAFPKIKEAIVNKLKKNPLLTYPTLIANNAWLSAGVEVGEGCIIYPHCSINYVLFLRILL
jgi:FlaA1/EpsC-like NDP-sugar epimerase